MLGDDEQLASLTGDDRIVMEARLDLQAANEWEEPANKWFREDVKFANADARNGWQWPDTLYKERDDADRPSLTINITRIHNDIVINDASKNKSSIKIRPTGGRASYESAQAMQSLVRRIEYISKATVAYRTVFEHQVDGGIGYILIDTDYVSERSWDQEIYLRAARDPLAVRLDPASREPDGSDANFGFVFEKMTRRKFNRVYRKYRDKPIGKSALGQDEMWLTTDEIAVATYHRRKGTKDTFVSYVEPQSGKRVEKLASEIKDEAGQVLFEGLIAQIDRGDIDGKHRQVINQSVEWFLIAGDTIIDRGKWAGKYIPICRCVGRETVVDGKLDRKGMTRQLIDGNRMLNYNASAQVEYGALQTKTPYVGPVRAFEGQEKQWDKANTKNASYLTYQDYDDEAPAGAQKIDAPKREQPPQSAPVYAEGAQMAERWVMMTSGQFQAQMGENDQQSAASGRAINERQRQGDTATYHFVEHQNDMLRHIGVQLIDLIPKIYDTERVLHILNEDGSKAWLKIAPDQEEAIAELKKEGDKAAMISFNPGVGDYDCISDPGPNYATQRQEGWNAVSQMLIQNMELATTIGDLLFMFGDFPGSEEIRERMKREIKATKPYLFDDEQDPGMQKAQAQLGELQKLNGELMRKLADTQLKLRGRDEKRDIDSSNAETKRLAVLVDAMAKLVLTPKDRAMLEHELNANAHDHALDMIVEANAPNIAGESKSNGAGS